MNKHKEIVDQPIEVISSEVFVHIRINGNEVAKLCHRQANELDQKLRDVLANSGLYFGPGSEIITLNDVKYRRISVGKKGIEQ